MSTIKYNAELFDLLKDLTAINTQIILENDNDQILVRRADSESTMAYELKAPKEFFDFEPKQIAFYNYPEFYQYFKAFREPLLSIKDNNITIKEETSKTNYLLSNPESIPPGPKSINFNEPDIKLNLSSSDLDELLKMIGLINSKKTRVVSDGKTITFKVFHTLHDNTFEKTFDIQNITDFDEEIDFVIFSETFKNLPAKKDYVIEIKARGFIKISLVDENMQLSVYTGKIKD